jgi:hypothetical protein
MRDSKTPRSRRRAMLGRAQAHRLPPGGLRGPSPPATFQRQDVLLHRQRRLVRRESGGRTVRLASTAALEKAGVQFQCKRLGVNVGVRELRRKGDYS